MADKDHFTTDEAAGYINLAASTLTKKRLYGDGPTYFKIGRRVIYKREDLDVWLERHRRSSTSDTGRAV